jgi:Kef-type K+ transport system membrane component KefB
LPGVSAWSGEFTTAALSLIAYLVGSSLGQSSLRQLGVAVPLIALGESAGAVVVVWLGLWLLLPVLGQAADATALALAFAAVACTTAPAGTIAVVRQYRADGPLTRTLLGVVALDDAFGIVLFSLATALAPLLLTVPEGAALSVPGELVHGLLAGAREIGLSLLLGGLAGIVLARGVERLAYSELALPLTLGVVLLVAGAADALQASPLLAAMATGLVGRRRLPAASRRLSEPLETLEETVFVLFFVLAGAHVDPRLLAAYLPLIGIYLVLRVAGKVLGARLAAQASGAEPAVARNIGWGLVPQAGVAVGLALSLGDRPGFEHVTPTVVNVVLGATVIHELVGPLYARWALARAGELGQAPRLGASE